MDHSNILITQWAILHEQYLTVPSCTLLLGNTQEYLKDQEYISELLYQMGLQPSEDSFVYMNAHIRKIIDDVVYWTWNRINKGEQILFISDPPHLIKTLGNNLENSHGRLNTRHLIVSVFLLIVLSFFLLYCKCVFPWNV